jgi:putative endonuclease
MAQHLVTGKQGEILACTFLEEKGYQILERNWKNRFEEIDVIARDGDELVIVEVKTRSSTAFGNPEQAVGLRKQRLLVNAAESYILKHDSHLETRFDIVTVILEGTSSRVQHLPRAFSPFD